jgi:tetratricopeptide (TPR) repeat protein
MRRRIFSVPGILSVALIFLPAIAPAALGQSRTEAANSIAAALRSHDFDQALRLAQSALRASPSDPQFLTMEGLALSGAGHNHEALAAYNSALKTAPHYLPALEGAAQIEYAAGDERAAAVLDRILAIHPNDGTAHAMMGVLAYKRRDYKSAIEHFQASGKVLQSQPAALEEYGFCLVQAGRPGEAEKVYADLVSVAPDDSRARIHLAAAQLLAGAPRDTLATLGPVLQQAAPDAEALDVASKAAEQIGDTPRAVQLLRKAIVESPDHMDYYLDFATLSFDHSSFKVGIDMLNVGLQRLPRSAPLYLARGILHIQMAQYDEGEADFETAERLDPRQAFSSESESLAKIQESGAGDALATVRSQLKVHPNDPVLLYLYAEALEQNGANPGSRDFEDALRAAERSVGLRPDLRLARDLLSKLYYDNGQLPQSIWQCRITLRADPSDQEALYRLTQALRKTGQTAEIPDLLRRLASLREEERKKEADRDRYKLIETAPVVPPSNQ